MAENVRTPDEINQENPMEYVKFWLSFYEAIQGSKTQKEKLLCYEILLKYGFFHENSDDFVKKNREKFPILYSVYTMAKPIIDNTMSHSVRGKTGGAPEGNTNASKQAKNKLKTTNKEIRIKNEEIRNKNEEYENMNTEYEGLKKNKRSSRTKKQIVDHERPEPFFNDPAVDHAFREYLADRAERKVDNTIRAVTLLINEIKRHDKSLWITAINNATIAHWNSVYFDSLERKQAQHEHGGESTGSVFLDLLNEQQGGNNEL